VRHAIVFGLALSLFALTACAQEKAVFTQEERHQDPALLS